MGVVRSLLCGGVAALALGAGGVTSAEIVYTNSSSTAGDRIDFGAAAANPSGDTGAKRAAPPTRVDNPTPQPVLAPLPSPLWGGAVLLAGVGIVIKLRAKSMK